MIEAKFKKYIIGHCKIKSKEYGVPLSSIQVRFNIGVNAESEESEVKYATALNYAKKEDNRLIEILHLWQDVDFIGISQIVPPFVLKALQSICAEQGIEENSVYVFAAPDDNGKDLYIHLYNGGQYLKEISLEQLIMGNMAEPDEEGSGSSRATASKLSN